MTETSPDPAPKPAQVVPPAEVPGMGWTKADMRSFLVTIAGTVIGGLVLVIFLGIAVILAKLVRDDHPNLVTWIAIVLVSVFALYTVGLVYYRYQRSTDKAYRRRTLRRMICASIILLMYVLIWVGILAGVK
jgi:O-antigen/teichoic acid export membrane protein